MDSFKISIDAETKEFFLKIPFDSIKEFLQEDKTITIPPDTFKQAYYFQHLAEDKENFSINAGIQDNYQQEEYDQEFWEDYHKESEKEFQSSNKGIEDSYETETGYIQETGEKNTNYPEEVGKETFGDLYYESKTQETWRDKDNQL
tara:strand:+ start:1302 stop:1739 length:438 start_codon:yes stop_codon:yes gene_type:complete